MENHEFEDFELLEGLLPSITAQMRGMLSSLHLASAALAPAEAREKNHELDKQAARMEQSYYQLLRLVNNLTAAMQLDARTPPTMRNCDLVELVERFCQETEPLAELLKLKLDFTCSLKRLISAVDPESIRQVLFQLLSNAMKFTAPGGSISVELKQMGELAVLEVSDTGRGMDDMQLKTLFDAPGRRQGPIFAPSGVGLGVALCRRIAEEHGGTLLAQSHPGDGTKFTLSLPIRQTESTMLSNLPFDYTGGFSRVLLGLADALPPEAYSIRNR